MEPAQVAHAVESVGNGRLARWEARVLRFTLFTSEPVQAAPDDWWQRVTGELPVETVGNPREGTRQVSGPALGGQLTVATQPQRIDWILSPNVAVEEGAPLGRMFDRIGLLTSVLPQFLEVLRGWIPQAPPSSRLAFAPLLEFPVEDRVRGYYELGPFLPAVQIDPEGTADLLYQINRPRPSRTGVPDLLINRLSKWAVAVFGVTGIALGGGPQQSVDMTVGHACRLEMDLNTAPQQGLEFSPEQALDLLEELVELGNEIAERGDIA